MNEKEAPGGSTAMTLVSLTQAELVRLHGGLQRIIAALEIEDDEAAGRPLSDL